MSDDEAQKRSPPLEFVLEEGHRDDTVIVFVKNMRSFTAPVRADTARCASTLGRPASGFSACRECWISVCLVTGCDGGRSLVALLQIYGFTDLRIHPLPVP